LLYFINRGRNRFIVCCMGALRRSFYADNGNLIVKKIIFLLLLMGCSYDYTIAVDTDTITYVINYETGDIYQKTLLEEPFLFESKENLNKPCMIKGIWYY